MKFNQPILDRYQIGDLLGQGSMGTVYQGADLETGSLVAIKVLNPDVLVGDPLAEERFNQEAQALRELDHPNIVRVLASAEQNGSHYLVMDFVSGGSLDGLLKRQGALDAPRTLEIGLDLADALTRTHRLGIIHRDIKPANILLENDGTARLSDYGIALVTRSPRLKDSNKLTGTLHYMSPEACQGQDASDCSDIWAFGVVLYETLTGDIPFRGTDPLALITAITTQPVPDIESRLPDAPQRLVDLIYRMLEKDPGRRIPSVRLVGSELEAVLQGRESQIVYHTGTRIPDSAPSQPEKIKHNLPAQVTAFIGREKEVNELSALICNPNTRLVTIHGQGGMGKTRLALQVAQAHISEFADGVYFISLAPLNLVEDIIPAVADGIGFKFHRSHDQKDQLIKHLQDRQILLVMDNFEHLINGSELVSELLQTSSGLKVLATSRETLDLPGEILFRLEGLQAPSIGVERVDVLDYSSIQLFIQEAQHLRPEFEIKNDDSQAVIEICQMVDGMPLGIILAASWIELLSPQEIVSEIRKNLDFLETDHRGIPDRQSSLRTIFNYSWEQLSESEQAVFSRLSVFRGGFTRHAAQVVASATIKQLLHLLNKSLVSRDYISGRFTMHELLRQFALEKLEGSGGIESVREAHCQYFSELLNRRIQTIRGPSQVETLEEIGVEFENVKGAWSWGVRSRNYDGIMNSAETLYVFCEWLNRYNEGEALFQMARVGLAPQGSDQPHPAWGRVLLPWYDLRVEGRGRLDEFETITSQANTALEAALNLDDKTGMAYAYVLLGAIAETTGFAEDAVANYEKGMKCNPDIGDSFWVLIRLGLCCRRIDDQSKSIQSFERSLARGRHIGDRVKIAWSQFNLGESIFIYRDQLNQELLDDVQHRWWEANILFQQVGSPAGQIWTSTDLMLLSFLQSDYAGVMKLAERILRIAAEIEYTSYGLSEAAGMLASVSVLEGEYQDARKYIQDWLLTKPAMGKALRSYAAICRPTILMMIIPAVVHLMAYDGEFDRAVKLLAAAFNHPARPPDLLERWPGIEKLHQDLRAELGSSQFESLWTEGTELGVDVMIEQLYNTYHRNKW